MRAAGGWADLGKPVKSRDGLGAGGRFERFRVPRPRPWPWVGGHGGREVERCGLKRGERTRFCGRLRGRGGVVRRACAGPGSNPAADNGADPWETARTVMRLTSEASGSRRSRCGPAALPRVSAPVGLGQRISVYLSPDERSTSVLPRGSDRGAGSGGLRRRADSSHRPAKGPNPSGGGRSDRAGRAAGRVG